MVPFSSPGKKAVAQTSYQFFQIGQGIQKLYDPSVTYCLSPNQLKRLPFFNFLTYFEDQNLLPTFQSAYHKHHSTETAVLYVSDEILQNAEHNKLTAMVCLDLSAAFDTINHTILRTVMEHYFGPKGTALQ